MSHCPVHKGFTTSKYKRTWDVWLIFEHLKLIIAFVAQRYVTSNWEKSSIEVKTVYFNTTCTGISLNSRISRQLTPLYSWTQEENNRQSSICLSALCGVVSVCSVWQDWRLMFYWYCTLGPCKCSLYRNRRSHCQDFTGAVPATDTEVKDICASSVPLFLNYSDLHFLVLALVL